MRIGNDSLIDTPEDMASSFNLPAIWLGHITFYSIQLVFTGTPAGTFKLQGSNDVGNSDDITNWTDLNIASGALSAAGSYIFNQDNAGYRWVRVVWTASGAGTTPLLTVARFNIKGIT